MKRAGGLAVLLAAALVATAAVPRIASAETAGTESLPPPGVRGVGIVAFTSGGTVPQLAQEVAGQGCALESTWVYVAGQPVGYNPAAPDFVNYRDNALDFGDLFPTGQLPADQIVVVVCRGGTPSTSPPTTTPSTAEADLAALPAYAVYETRVGGCTWVFARLPGEAFVSGAGPDGRLFHAFSNEQRGKGGRFATFEQAMNFGIEVIGGVLAGDTVDTVLPECNPSTQEWTTDFRGTGLMVLRDRLDANGIFLEAFLDPITQASGVELTAQTRGALIGQ